MVEAKIQFSKQNPISECTVDSVRECERPPCCVWKKWKRLLQEKWENATVLKGEEVFIADSDLTSTNNKTAINICNAKLKAHACVERKRHSINLKMNCCLITQLRLIKD